MSKDNGGPAFPCEGGRTVMSGNAMHKTLPSDGMTLRDYFAAKALPGLLATCEREPGGATSSLSASALAAASYEMADAMLLERAK